VKRAFQNIFVTLSPSEQMPFNPAAAKSILGLDEKSNLVLLQNFTDNIGQMHYRYYQTYKGIAIENTMYILHTSSGKLTGLSGIIVTDFSNAMQQRANTAAITPEKAISLAIDFVGAKIYMWQNAAMEARYKKQMANANATYKPTASLVWYNAGTDVNETDLQLAYKVDVYAKEPLSRAYYYVNAATGKIMGKKDELFYSDAVGTANTEYSGSRNIHSDLYNGKYRLWDLTRGNGVITLHGDKLSDLDYTSTTSNWVLKNQNRHAMDVHFGVAATYDYFKAKFNRSSVDGNGIALISYVNDGEQDNAHWDGTSMNFGIRSTNSKGVTGIDVTGHELTHGVTQYSCGFKLQLRIWRHE